MPTEFTFEEASQPRAKEFSFEEANSFSFDDAAAPAARDTSRDSYEAQLQDLGLTPDRVAADQAVIDRRSDLLAAQGKAARTGQYWQGVADRAGALSDNVVEPLTRPVSGAVGRAADAVIPGGPVVEPVLQQAGVNLPRAGEATTTGGQIAAGVYNAAADLIHGFTSPDMLVQLPAAANKTVLTAWISQMAGHQPERVLRAAELVKAGKTQEAAQEITMGVAELGMAELGRRHVMKGDALQPADVNGAPALRMNPRGEAVDLPNPDLVARNLAAPGTVRPTEQAAMASPLEGRKPAEVVFERVPILNPAGEVVDVQVKPRIREIVIEEPSVIVPETRFLKPDVEGGRLGFNRGAEDFIEARNEPPAQPKGVTDNGQRQERQGQEVLERPSRTIEETKAPATESPAVNVGKATEMPAEAGASPAPEPVQQKPAKGTKEAAAENLKPETSNPETAEIDWSQNPFSTETTSQRLTQLDKEKPRPTDKLYGASGGTPELRAANDVKVRQWQRDRAKAVKEHREMVQKSNEWIAQQRSPGMVSGTAAEAWADRTIQQARGRVNTGLDPELFGAYVVKGAAHLERGIRKFSDWSRKMIAEHGDPIRPHLRRVFEESQRAYSRTAEDLNGLRQRKLAARGSQAATVPEVHRERMRSGRESFYEPQDVGRVEDVVSRMTSEELSSVPLVEVDGPQNIGIAARLERYRRLVAADRLDAAWKVIEDTMKLGTSLGQLVNQFKLLRGSTPDGVMVMLNKQLLAGGFDPVPPVEALRIRRLAEESIKANAKWKEAERNWKDAPTDANFKQVEGYQSDAIAADSLLRERLRRFEPRTLGGTLSTLFKGNLIAPISQARNVVGNTVNLAARGGVRNIAVALDAVDAALRNRPRTRALVPLRGSKEAMKAIGRSLPDSLEVLRRGGSEVDLGKADARVGLRPLVALREAILADVLGPKRNGKTPLAQRLMAGLEATPFGMHAAAQLRTLGAVDKPFKAAARARLVTEAMKVQDLNRKQRIATLRKDPSPAAQIERQALERMRIYTADNVAKAVKFPELFLDAETVARIDGEAAAAVYQQKNVITRFKAAGERAVGIKPDGMVRFAIDTIAPFVTTPANVIGEWLSYAPPVALYNLGRHAWRGESRPATQSAGKLVVGSMAFLAGQWLYNKGLVSPTLDQSDEQQKARILSGQSMPAGRLNMTGLERALRGETGGWQPGDVTVDVLSAGGLLGAVFQTVADVNRRTETQPEEPGVAEKAGIFGANYVQMTAGYGVQQSFLKGTATLLEALMSPQKTENWLATYLDSLSAMALPNTMTAISRATREAKPELRGDALDERLNNQIKNRIAGVQRLAGGRGADADLPLKRDLWGRPIPETPEGSNAYLAQFLDVTKGQRVANDPVALHLYSLWRRTSDLAVIPTPPDANFSVAGKQFDPLTRAQVDDLQEIVGGIRYRMAQQLFNNPRFYLAPAGEQVDALRVLWSRTGQLGSMQFYKRHSSELQSRREKAGFVPE